MSVELTQDHMTALANLDIATRSVSTAFITLIATYATLPQQLIDVDLELIKAVAEVVQLKVTISAQPYTHVPAVGNFTEYYWFHCYKACLGKSAPPTRLRGRATRWIQHERIPIAERSITRNGRHEGHSSTRS